MKSKKKKSFLCFKTYTRYSWIADEEQKKVLDIFISDFETYTRYFRVADEKQKKSHRFYLESPAVNSMRKSYIEMQRFFIL